MDAIDKAIEAKNHINTALFFYKQIWEEFEAVAKDNRIVLFGAGVGADYYIYKYGSRAKIDGCIDNNINIQGVSLRDVLWEAMDDQYENIRIHGVSLLETMNPNETLILITILRNHESVISDLIKRGFNKCFSLLLMENTYRNSDAYKQNGESHQFRNIDHICNLYKQVPIIKNKIVIYTECDGVGHGKEIAKGILSNSAEVDIVWFVNNLKSTVPSGVRKILRSNFRAFAYEFLTAKIILVDTLITDAIKKREGQLYIQIKHWGSITLKTFGYDYAKNSHDLKMMEICDGNQEMTDYIMVGSDFDEKTCRSGFGERGVMVHVGSPRSDILFRDDNLVARETYNVPSDVKLMLYAPTFRLYSNEWENVRIISDLNYEMIKKAVEHKFGGKWMFLFRVHPAFKAKKRDFFLPEYVIDVSDYQDGEELVAVSDIMITDYSSIMFEPAYVKKPVFLLATDLHKYLEEERGFLIDYNTLPFPIAESNEELGKNIEHFDVKKYEQKIEQFLVKYGVHEDGHAGERAARFIIDLLDGKGK